MNIVLLDAKTLGEDLNLSALEAFGELVKHQTTSADETLDRIKTAEIIITNKVVITAQMMEEAPQLKLICIAATGMNNVDLDAAKTMGIEVKNVAGYSTQSVVQHTFRVATAFGAKVCYHSTSGENYDQKYPHVELESMMRECNIISIHCPLNDKTHNLINASNLGFLKEGSVLLNLGRGSIVDEADLAKELDKREIYAGLDVLTPEPVAEDNPLMDVVNQNRLLITPHIAWTSMEARKKLLEGIVENIKTFMEK